MKPISEQNHYEILEIQRDASPEEAERAYRMARATYAEDSLAGYSVMREGDAEALRERVEIAYRVLSDPEARRAYDATIEDEVAEVTEAAASSEAIPEPTPVEDFEELDDETGEFEFFATPFPGPGRKWQISSSGTGGRAYWTRGDREIVYVDGENRLVAVDIQAGPGADELTIGAPRVLFDIPGTIEGYDVTADGERFLFVQSPTVQADEPLTLVVNWTAELGK